MTPEEMRELAERVKTLIDAVNDAVSTWQGDLPLLEDQMIGLRCAVKAFDKEEHLTALRAAAEQPKGWRVKELEWDGDFAHNDMGGFYHLESTRDGRIALYFHTGSSKTGLAVEDSITALEPLAQAHHARRISEAIEPAPISVEEAARVLLRNRFGDYRGHPAFEAAWEAYRDSYRPAPFNRVGDAVVAALTAIAGGEE